MISEQLFNYKTLIEFHKNTKSMAPVTSKMNYYQVSIAACRHILIDFFTLKTASISGRSNELKGVSAGGLHSCQFYEIYLFLYIIYLF